MSTTDAPTIADPLERGIRRMRLLRPPDAPFPATRASIGDEVVLLTRAEELAAWRGWACGGAQHLLGPRDIVRRTSGHEVVLADLREPCGRACGVREESRAGWHRGEAVTLIVSVLRGVCEAEERGIGEDTTGSWWLAVDGRPVFVFDAGEAHGDPVAAASSALVRRVVAACDDRVIVRIGDDVVEALERPAVLARRLEELEEALFGAAAPQPVDADPARAHGAAGLAGRAIELPDEPREATILGRLAEALENHVDGRVADLVRGAVSAVTAARRDRTRRRDRKPRGDRPPRSPRGERRAEREPRPERAARGRRGVFLVGAGAAALVLLGGVLWPAGDDSEPSEAAAPEATGEPAAVRGDEEHAARPDEGGGETEAATPAPSEAPASEEPAPDAALFAEDPVAAAAALLARGDACDADCAEILRPDAAVDGREIAIVDDFGAAVLLAVTAPEHDRQMLVVERVDDTWRLRDVYGAPRA